jgi:hypothetical protein
MNTILTLIALLLLLGGSGGFSLGGATFGDVGLVILIVALIVYFLGGLRGRA